jgi:hypothetical protein
VIECFAVKWIGENYKWLFDGLGGVVLVAFLGWLWRTLSSHSNRVPDLAQDIVRIPSKEMGSISFSYLPASPLSNGWRLALGDKPLRQASASTERLGGLTIQMDDAIDIDVAKFQRLCNRVLFAAKLSDKSYAYAKIRLASTASQTIYRDVWIACDIGDRLPRQESTEEWVIYRKPDGDGWANFDLSLPDEVGRTFGQTDEFRFSELLGFRLRGSMSISPIDLYRADPPDSSGDQRDSTEDTRRRPPSRSHEITWLVGIMVLAVGVGFFIRESRGPSDQEHPVKVQSPSQSPPPQSPTAEPNKLLVAQTAKDFRELRQQNHVSRLADSESGKAFAEIPANSFGYVSSPELVYMSSTGGLSIGADGFVLDFEIQKLGDGGGLLVGFVGAETFQRLREGVPTRTDMTLYSAAWKDAPNLVAVPVNGLKYSRSRVLHVEGVQHKPVKVVALDCAVQ